ncbi:EAL domain-containing protein [Deinococcus sp. KSM4-11]|uniref:putative bifunctional diguanylate cyclase/phosphodiesterase n=1 Tax=Deinococcus sp. KSM4-11 TaxID=2568654 RepID=UPI0010A48B58|nr:EAL domain-containing protein [Deinococcus sp. KSM4-11]THF84382.1 EAL domain-containing protein [Deinococcus sp. KSM4-11]
MRLQVLLSLACSGLILMLTVWWGMPSLVIQPFDQQEIRGMDEDTRRVTSAVQSELTNLSYAVLNWSDWDETYAYARRPDPAFIAANVIDGTFEGQRLNLIMILNRQGQLISAHGFDLDSKRQISVSAQGRAFLRQFPALQVRDLSTHVEGIAALPGQVPWLLASRPIRTSDGTGPVTGTLVMGRLLSPTLLSDLKRDPHLRLTVQAGTGLPASAALAKVLVTTPDASRIQGRSTLPDLSGRSSVTLTVATDRPGHANGVRAARVLLACVLTAVLLLTLLSMILVETLVLRPLAQYRGQVRHLMAGQLTQRFTVRGRNELNALGQALNALLDRTEHNQEQVQHQATHDALTGLPNRLHLHREFQRLFDCNEPFAVALLDLNNFKAINDTLGHEVGDEVLRAAATQLQAALPRNAFCARLGGDEFALLLPGIVTSDQAVTQVSDILACFNQPLQTSAASLHVKASAGTTLWPSDASTASMLMRYADLSMYRAKALQCDVQPYSVVISDAMERRNSLERDLHGAVTRGELWLAYQPQVNLITSEVVGCEALVRWNHPQFGAVPPGTFIPIAEERGLIHQMGTWILRSACAQAAEWAHSGRPTKVSVNVSAVQLQDPAFPDLVAQVLRDTGLSPSLLELEVTETAVLVDLQAAVQHLTRVRALGVSVALDDFGTGYASLELVRELPLDYLKLDRSFVTDAVNDARRQVIVSAVIQLAHSLGLDVIAEGVEHHAERELLLSFGCTVGQGYLFARPLAALDVALLLPGTGSLRPA